MVHAKTSKRIGIALSGGGFRAAAFHLGVFRKLQQLRLLEAIDLLSCVSGGSIAGAFLALHWGKSDTLDRLESYLASRSIAVTSVLAGLLNPFTSRVKMLAEAYDHDLFDGATLEALRSGPRIYLNATNLASGNMFFFVAGGGAPEELGEHQLGVQTASNVKLSLAVAASSAFPPVFNPVVLPKDLYAAPGLVERVTLTDGGVYDNLGVNPLLRVKRNPIDYAIVSDGGKPLDIVSTPTRSGLRVPLQAIGILMDHVRGLQFDRLEHYYSSGKGPKPVWFSIDSHIGEAISGDATKASAIATNLRALSRAEMTTLVRHGGALIESRLRQYAPDLL